MKKLMMSAVVLCAAAAFAQPGEKCEKPCEGPKGACPQMQAPSQQPPKMDKKPDMKPSQQPPKMDKKPDQKPDFKPQGQPSQQPPKMDKKPDKKPDHKPENQPPKKRSFWSRLFG